MAVTLGEILFRELIIEKIIRFRVVYHTFMRFTAGVYYLYNLQGWMFVYLGLILAQHWLGDFYVDFIHHKFVGGSCLRWQMLSGKKCNQFIIVFFNVFDKIERN